MLLNKRAAVSIAAFGLLTASAIGLGNTPAGARMIADALHACSNSNACLQWTNNGSGPAIVGLSKSSDGVRGKTSGSSSSGVYAENDATTGGYAMYASSPNNGLGIFAYSKANTALAATSDSGVGLYSRAGSGGANPAIIANQDNTTCTPTCVPIIVAQVSGTTHVMSLDTQGNMIISGSLTQNGSPQLVTKTRLGRDVVAYAPRESQPAIEDFGEATLANGVAHVALEPTFSAAIDGRASYLVFLTPQGATSGTLYVADKSPTGFAVREAGGDRSHVAFDYRVVAKPLDSAQTRLPIWKAAAANHYALPNRK